MCSICGDSGYTPAVVGTNTDQIMWADHAVMEPCLCVKWQWSYHSPHFPQPIFIPVDKKRPGV